MTATATKPKQRREPWHVYPRLDKRLRDWADWLHAETSEHIGWSVYTGDADSVLRVQLRNDVYADPVGREVENLKAEDRRNWMTNLAVASLPQVWRTIVWLLYVPVQQPKRAEIAESVGLDERALSTHMWQAFRELDGVLDISRRNAVQSARVRS